VSLATAVYERFLSFRRIPLKVVGVTLLASWALQLGAIFLNQPIYVIVLFTILPWLPLALFEGIWKYRHYNWLAVFAVITVLQVGHYGEHVVQVSELAFFNGTIACPPPVDNVENAQRAVDAGLRQSVDDVTNNSAVWLIVPGEDGQPAPGDMVGPPACGVFGQFDFEPIHLIWDTAVWLGGLVLLTKFPRNIFLWIAVAFASLHEVEHLFLGYIYLTASGDGAFEIPRQLWATTADGAIVTGHPVGKEVQPVDFYHAGGLTGIMGKNGLVESLLLGQLNLFPLRPYLHFIYNSLVVIPTVIAFLYQSRKAYDEYLATALPALTEDQRVRASTKLERQTFEPGEVIVRQGELADKFYIITRGQAEVLREQNGEEILVSRLGTGQYFGEIGLMHGGRRIATVRAADKMEVMALDRDTFGGLMDESEMSREQVERLTRQRVAQLQGMRSG
jgi:hypothetical protein